MHMHMHVKRGDVMVRVIRLKSLDAENPVGPCRRAVAL
jgi:hypothetical protein